MVLAQRWLMCHDLLTRNRHEKLVSCNFDTSETKRGEISRCMINRYTRRREHNPLPRRRPVIPKTLCASKRFVLREKYKSMKKVPETSRNGLSNLRELTTNFISVPLPTGPR